MQYYKNCWAQIFNIGVQVFWALSGYLYGKKTIESWGNFYKKRISKVYLPFIIWVFGVFLVFHFKGVRLTVSHVLTYFFSLQGEVHYFSRYGVKGLGHLWFLTGLWFCYLSLPLLQYCRKKYLPLLFSALFLMLVLYGSVIFFSSYYLWIFAFSYLYGYLEEGRTKRTMRWMVYVVAIFFLLTTTWEHLQHANYWRLHHLFIGIACLLGVIDLSQKIYFYFWWRQYIVKISHFSYYIYLTHMVWIFGPLSVLNIYGTDGCEIISLSLVFILTIMSSLFLFYIIRYVDYLNIKKEAFNYPKHALKE